MCAKAAMCMLYGTFFWTHITSRTEGEASKAPEISQMSLTQQIGNMKDF